MSCKHPKQDQTQEERGILLACVNSIYELIQPFADTNRLTCMFLARKTENYLMSIEDFSKVLKSPAESILQLEFLVCKTLRFHFTVHHPYRPCLGFFFDMQVL